MKKWIADIRVGCCLVYFAEKQVNCVDDAEYIFYRGGKFWLGKWKVKKIYEYQARFLAWILNTLKCKES